MNPRNLDADRRQVAELAVEHWWLRHSDAAVEDANAAVERVDALVEHWAAAGALEEFLEPLLDDSSAEVRYTAAVAQLRRAPTNRARHVLTTIAQGDHGPVSAAAQLLSPQ